MRAITKWYFLVHTRELCLEFKILDDNTIYKQCAGCNMYMLFYKICISVFSKNISYDSDINAYDHEKGNAK